ncbi:MAG: bifunctional riboflavin kinase/FAD synthetase [Pseudomonadota bacterium]|nr:bifunctional riboflavin kinase/FAD synthetase [Pseudomonadota bacterium]
MHIYKHYIELPKTFQNSSIAIGNFDGMHKGHCKVINQAGIYAHDRGLPWGVLTFEPHPREIFDRDKSLFRLTPFDMKVRLIEILGVDFLVVIQFDKDFANKTADEFVDQVLVQGFGASYVVSGFNFAFGKKRTGNIRFLQKKGKNCGFGTNGISQVLDENGRVISSTRIRNFLSNGNPRAAANLLGRDYEIEGLVSRGDQRGNKIGFPTANIELDQNIKIATGVYSITAGVDRGNDTVWHNGIANLGYRPTFNGNKYMLEAHLFDFDKNIYGANLRVKLIDFIRSEVKFDGVESLTTQIKKDISISKTILTSK